VKGGIIHMDTRYWRCIAVCALALLVVACGVSSTQAQSSSQPPHLTLQVVVSPIHNATPSSTQTYVGNNPAAVQAFYQHMLALHNIPSTVDVACLPGKHTYQFTFAATQGVVAQATITQCLNILQLSDHTERAPDDAFWSLLDAAIGQQLAPQ
jgi:hypothetical protein